MRKKNAHGAWAVDEVRKHKNKRLVKARNSNLRWGEMYTPEEVRPLISSYMEDIDPSMRMWSRALFQETETAPNDLGLVHAPVQKGGQQNLGR
jgi:hypothetical protein